MSSLHDFERVRQADANLRTMNLDDVPIGKPIDERSLITAASDPSFIPMKKMKQIHEQSGKNHKQSIRDAWSTLANSLPQHKPHSDNQQQPHSNSSKILSNIPKRKHIILQTYQDIANDLRNFKTLPYKTNLEKLGSCFFSNNRGYLSITTFVAICIILIIILLLCIRPRK